MTNSGMSIGTLTGLHWYCGWRKGQEQPERAKGVEKLEWRDETAAWILQGGGGRGRSLSTLPFHAILYHQKHQKSGAPRFIRKKPNSNFWWWKRMRTIKIELIVSSAKRLQWPLPCFQPQRWRQRTVPKAEVCWAQIKHDGLSRSVTWNQDNDIVTYSA